MRVTASLAAVVFACHPSSVPTPPDPAPDVPVATAAGPAGASAASVEVVLRPAAPRVRLREALALTVTVRNPGVTPLVIPLTSGCLADFEVLDASGRLLGSSEQMCTQALGSRTVPAGDSVSAAFAWTPGQPGNAGATPGTYRLRGVLLRQGGPVRSTPVTVEVLSPG